jgi:hypothetical protein
MLRCSQRYAGSGQRPKYATYSDPNLNGRLEGIRTEDPSVKFQC